MKKWIIGSNLKDYKYFDDHLEFEIYDEEQSEGIAIIADGVSNCDGGRIAAIVVCEAIKDFFKRKRNSFFYKREPFLLIDDAFAFAGQELLRKGHEINEKKSILINEFLETRINNSNIIKNLKKRINNNLERTLNQDEILNFESTAIIAFFKNNDIYLGMVGDGEILQFSPPNTFYPYLESKGSLRTYFSTKEGLQGPIRKLHINLTQGGVLCFGSDGVKFKYVSKGGAAFSLFINKLSAILLNKQIIEFPRIWCDTLIQNNALEDDFSMFILYLENKLLNQNENLTTIENLTNEIKNMSVELQNTFSSIINILNDHAENLSHEILQKEKIAIEKIGDAERIISKSLEMREEMEKRLYNNSKVRHIEGKRLIESLKMKLNLGNQLIKNLDEKYDLLLNKGREIQSRIEFNSINLEKNLNYKIKSFENQLSNRSNEIHIKTSNCLKNIRLKSQKDLDKKVKEIKKETEKLFENETMKIRKIITKYIKSTLEKIENEFISKVETKLSKIENRIKNNIEISSEKFLKEQFESFKVEMKNMLNLFPKPVSKPKNKTL